MNLCNDDGDNHEACFLSLATFSASVVGKHTGQSQGPSLQNPFPLTFFPKKHIL